MSFLDYLFEVIQKEEFSYKIKLTSKEHPVFKAHFPNNPILPGFLQIDIIENLFSKKLKKIKKTKFMGLILPEDEIEIKHHTSKYQVTIYKENKKITELVYE